MPSIVKRIKEYKLSNPPDWLPTNVMYETIMGSMAYGVSSDSSDCDIYGFCIPEKTVIFPHLAGYIPGFGKKPQSFNQWQEHHIKDKSAGKEYDINIYSIVKYFQLCMDNNPNMIDSLFTPQNCVLYTTHVGSLLRDNRKKFLHKGCWHRFKGYAFSNLHKAQIKNPQPGSKRYDDVVKNGWDCKFGYHVVRLIGEVEQILSEGDLDLQRDRERLKAIRRGEMSFEEVKKYFEIKEKSLEKLYNESSLRHSPNEHEIKQLLLDCLEHHYGNLEKAVINPDKAINALRDIANVIRKNNDLL